MFQSKTPKMNLGKGRLKIALGNICLLVTTPAAAFLPTLPLESVGTGALGGAVGYAPSEVLSAFRFETSKVWLQEVRFRLDKQINNNSTVDIHIIFINSEEASRRLMEMTSDQYFGDAEQILNDYRGSIEVFTTTIIPGQNNDPLYLSPQNVTSSIRCIMFARYGAPGAHRYDFGSDRIVEVQLGNSGFSVTTIKK